MSALLSPIALRGVTARNRIAVSPMCQYSATDGVANDWHLVHLGRFAQGGAGIVFVEATAVEARGRITNGDLGLWHDGQVEPLRRVASFLKAQGAVPAIQLGHAGRKGSAQRPWDGNGPLGATDAARGDAPWPTVAPSPIPMAPGWHAPAELSAADIPALVQRWREAAARALAAGFEIAEVHAAHGYLLHQFLSPLSNARADAYGGDLAGRMRLPLEVAEAVRAAWPEDRPVFVRVSAVDGVEGGISVEDTVAFAKELKARGIDVVDVSSGGLQGAATAARVRREPGFQVPFAERVRREAGIPTMAVGLILEPAQAEAIVRDGRADIVALAREALFNPNWPHHARLALEGGGTGENAFADWPEQSGWWLERREAALADLGLASLRNAPVDSSPAPSPAREGD